MLLKNERGMILPITLMIMLLLTTVAVAVGSLATSEPQIAKNLADAARARAVAEAGLEVAYLQVANAASFTSLISTANSSGVVALATNATLPGLTAAQGGSYSVIIRNDTKTGDPQITGVAAEASTTVDANNRLIMVATGTFGNAVRQIQVMVKKTPLPPIPGALNFPGNDADTYFQNDYFEVSGNDFKTDGTAGTCSSVYGITTATATRETTVQNSLSSVQKDNVTGKKQVSSGTANGDNVIAPDSTLTQASIQSFVKDVTRSADISLFSPSPSGLSYSDIGSTCSTNWASDTCWGTAAKPKVVYIKGAADPSSLFTALTLNGNVTGYGILIVEDGDLKVLGNFTWNGLVMVTGQWVGLGLMGASNSYDQYVYGAVISNETSTDPLYEGVVYADAKIRYSCQALNNVATARKLITMSSWTEVSQ
jgi:Tfp pilus assembly protein PilX